jgi:acetylornithine deacetylase/succinyl-diaminopimelate desuccinylase-like protein
MDLNSPSSEAQADALRFVEQRRGEVVALTEALIAAPSPNLPGDETAPAEVVRAALARYGLPAGKTLALEPHRPNVIVRIDGARPGPHLGICGHLDTKPVGDAAGQWRTDPFTATIDGDRLYGLGSTDMKGAVAAMILAGAAFQSVADRLAGSLSLIFTADEEYGSRYGAEYLSRQGGLDVDAIVLAEPSGLTRDWEATRIVSRGVCCFRVLVGGTQTHSSISDALPTVNAVEAMAKTITGLRRELRPRVPPHPLCPTGPTINIGVKALGGVGYGVIPGHAEFWTDIRTTPGMTSAALREDIEAALARVAPETPGATITLDFSSDIGWVDATEVPADHPAVVAVQSAAAQILGEAPPLAAFHGGTDAWAFQSIAGIPTIAAFGPGLLPLAHGPNEWVSITALEQAVAMFALAAIGYCG